MMTRRVVALVVIGALLPHVLLAHRGPPYPIIVDRQVGPYLVSVWTDPDIGTGKFYIVLEAPEGQQFVQPSAIRVAVEPKSGRRPEAEYDAEPQRAKTGARYYAEVEFDEGEWWAVRVTIDGPAGGGQLNSEVLATPAGDIGPFGLLVYSLPFVLIAALWWRATVVRRRMTAEAAEP